MSPRLIRAVLVGGLLAGLLDILFAITFAATRGVSPLRLLQTVASGWLGERAFEGGVATAALGLASHFALALAWAAVFCAIARRVPAVTARPGWAAVVYGAFVLLAMRLVVLPLSAYPYPVSFKPLPTLLDLGSHVAFFAWPIALAARRAVHADRSVADA